METYVRGPASTTTSARTTTVTTTTTTTTTEQNCNDQILRWNKMNTHSGRPHACVHASGSHNNQQQTRLLPRTPTSSAEAVIPRHRPKAEGQVIIQDHIRSFQISMHLHGSIDFAA